MRVHNTTPDGLTSVNWLTARRLRMRVHNTTSDGLTSVNWLTARHIHRGVFITVSLHEIHHNFINKLSNNLTSVALLH
jgi:hypothetical protein